MISHAGWLDRSRNNWYDPAKPRYETENKPNGMGFHIYI
jgi:hypothetical protein